MNVFEQNYRAEGESSTFPVEPAAISSLVSYAELMASRLLGMMSWPFDQAIVTMLAIRVNYIFLVVPRRNLPGESLLASTIKAMYIARCLRLSAMRAFRRLTLLQEIL